MTWAERQRAMVLFVIGLIVLAALTILGFSIFYKVPTCTDQKQNQNEEGVDCGGSCTTLCSVRTLPAVKFVRTLTPQPGRTDVLAYVENGNAGAEAKDATFLLEVYGANRELIAQKEVTADLPPLATVPVYVPDVTPRGSMAIQAFLTPMPESTVWKKAGEKLVLPTVERITVTEGERPRVTAALVNPTARPVYNTTLIAAVFDANGNVIAASQTLVASLPSQGTAPMVFTWNAPFAASVARVEILPLPKLPTRAP